MIRVEPPLKYIQGKFEKIKLPQKSKIVPLTIGTVVGWGESNMFDLNQLKGVNIPIRRQEECSMYRITEEVFCAGQLYKSGCMVRTF